MQKKKKKSPAAAQAAAQARAEAWQTRQFEARALPGKFLRATATEPETYPVVSNTILTPFGVVSVVTASKYLRPLAA